MSNERYKLLISNDTFLMCYRGLAEKIGLNAAMIVQEVSDWIEWAEKDEKHDNHFDGRWWVWKSWNQWCRRFPWWSKKTIRRNFGKLVDSGILLTKTRSREDGGDDAPWYTINFDALEAAIWTMPSDEGDPVDKMTMGGGQNDHGPGGQDDHPKETKKNQEKKDSTATDAAAASLGSADDDDPLGSVQGEKDALKGNRYQGLSTDLTSAVAGGKGEKVDVEGNATRQTFHPSTALEKYLIEHTGGHNKRTFTKKQREKLNMPISTHRLADDGKEGEPVTSPSLNQFYDETPDFRRYVTQRIRTLNEIIKNKPGLATQKGVDGAINSLKDMARPETGWFAWSSDPMHVPPVLPESSGTPDLEFVFDDD